MNISLLFTSIVQAQQLTNPIGSKNITEFISALLGGITGWSIPILTLVFIWIGFKFIISQGKPEELKKVKAWALFAILGTLLIVSAEGIYNVIKGTIEGVTGRETGSSSINIDVALRDISLYGNI